MRLAINHEKYTHVDISGYRERANGHTHYSVVVVPVIVDAIWVQAEVYAGYSIPLVTAKRASNKSEDLAREVASVAVPEALFNLAKEYGFEEPNFDARLLTFTVC